MLGLFSDNSHKDSTMIHLLTYVTITCVDFDNMAIIYTNTHRYIYISNHRLSNQHVWCCGHHSCLSSWEARVQALVGPTGRKNRFTTTLPATKFVANLVN